MHQLQITRYKDLQCESPLFQKDYEQPVPYLQRDLLKDQKDRMRINLWIPTKNKKIK